MRKCSRNGTMGKLWGRKKICFRIAICDDEEYYRNKIHTLLDSWFAGRGMEYTVSLFSSGADFLSEKENAVGYDVVFMVSTWRKWTELIQQSVSGSFIPIPVLYLLRHPQLCVGGI